MPLDLKQMKWPEYPRAGIRATLLQNSMVPLQHVDEVVDLACHAAETARKSMLEVLERSSSPMVELTAVGLANSLVANNTQILLEGARRGGGERRP